MPTHVHIAHGVWKAGVAGLPQAFDMPRLCKSIKKKVLEPEFSVVVGYFFPDLSGQQVFFLSRKFIICKIPSIKGCIKCCYCQLEYSTVSWVVGSVLGGWCCRQVSCVFTSVSRGFLYYALTL